MRHLIFGGDIGNHALKAVFGENNRLYMINTVREVGETKSRPTIGEDEKVIDTLDIIIRCPHYEALNNRRFWVGNNALGMDEYQTSVKTKKTENDLILVPLLASIALQANQNGEEFIAEGIIGLPMLEYIGGNEGEEEIEREKFRNKITGEYEIEFVTTASLKGWKVKFKLIPHIKPESLLVILRQMIGLDGKIIHSDWKGQSMGSIDIGGFSTDVGIIDENHKPDGSLCRGFQFGAATALDEISKAIAKNYGYEFPRHMIEKFINRDNCQMRIGAKVISIKEIVESNFRATSNQISQGIIELMKNPKASQVARFFVFGGGAVDYKKYLINNLSSKIMSELIWLTDNPDEMVFYNAYAFYFMMKAMRARMTKISG
ncbi:ParM/StbA family protein [Brevibacillus halotolerans]|uniref:ParM/StbA family protein n=1 Tax=Brevibacillus halotolerans TaxID=1507437 RepID=UPI0015EF2C74|nr:ParM/StbA family protein [Brevibacillus halotolerans]MBA4533810.1 ParM/StbA family protein [Brevibacillus halotolerans]